MRTRDRSIHPRNTPPLTRAFALGMLLVMLVSGCAAGSLGIPSATSAPTLGASGVPGLSDPSSATQAETRSPTPVVTQPLSPTPAATPTLTLTPAPSPTATPEAGVFFSIGQSVQGRDLEVVRFGSGPVNRMIVAGIHGGYEWNTTDLANELIETLRQNPQMVPNGITLYILPSLNPDGYAAEFGAAGRANANGVDLNRNWDAYWSPTWSGVACWNQVPISAGEYPFSEPETQALAAFLEAHPVDALISYHSAALGIFSGGQTDDPASQSLARALSAVSGYPYPALDYGCEYTGQLIDWVILRGAAAVTIELTNHTDTDYAANLRVLEAFLKWERRFVGVILERYPVSAEADEILIIQTGE